MSYLVFSRKFRPGLFSEVAGQSHVTSTLKRALETGRIGQAYLFTGPRGTGKTTIARILARALNCHEGVKPDPCNRCVSCKEISVSSSVDVLEIDGASNRRIEEIRNLRENVKFAPARDRFKIYIIDEIHMLTTEAFNALLKTLEEPPGHVKFIFATTAPHKLPPTIISRCQRFDLRRISLEDIAGRLSLIAEKEKIDAAPGALKAIARAASGSMRDAESIFDQLASSCEDTLTEEKVGEMLGLIPEETFVLLADAVKNSETLRALEIINRVIEEGKDAEQFVKSWLGYWRDMLLVKAGGKDLAEISENHLNQLGLQAANFSIPEILRAAEILFKTQELLKKTVSSRIPLEMAAAELTLQGAEQASPGRSADGPGEEKNPLFEHGGERKTPEGKNEAPGDGKSERSCPREINAGWGEVLAKVKSKSVRIHGFLLEGRPASSAGGRLTLEFSSKFHMESCLIKENRETIDSALEQVYGKPLKMECVLSEESQPEANEPEREESPEEKRGRELRETAKKDPVIRKVKDILKVDILEVKEEDGE